MELKAIIGIALVVFTPVFGLSLRVCRQPA